MGAQLCEGGVLVPPHLRAQQLLVAGQEACRVAAAVRARCEALPGAVQAEHFVNKGSADAEQVGDFRDGMVAAQGGLQHPLAQVERVGFHSL